MKAYLVILVIALFAASTNAAVIVDDFESTSLLWPQKADFSDPWPGGPADSAPGTLFGERRTTLAVMNSPVGSNEIQFSIDDGALSVAATPFAIGRLYLYHDSFFTGPYFDLEPFIAADGGVSLLFATPLTRDIQATIVFQSTNGRLSLGPTFLQGSTSIYLPFSDFFSNDGETFFEVYETRWFFDIPEGSSFSISEIAIIPEPNPTLLFAFGFFTVIIMRTMRCTEWLPASRFLRVASLLCRKRATGSHR
jgi:hypothetical protein